MAIQIHRLDNGLRIAVEPMPVLQSTSIGRSAIAWPGKTPSGRARNSGHGTRG